MFYAHYFDTGFGQDGNAVTRVISMNISISSKLIMVSSWNVLLGPLDRISTLLAIIFHVMDATSTERMFDILQLRIVV